jgi:hypothetical protein
VEALKASQLSVVQTNEEVKASLLTPAQPVDSLIPAARLASASNKSSSLHRVSIGDNGGGKFHYSKILIVEVCH